MKVYKCGDSRYKINLYLVTRYSNTGRILSRIFLGSLCEGDIFILLSNKPKIDSFGRDHSKVYIPRISRLCYIEAHPSCIEIVGARELGGND